MGVNEGSQEGLSDGSYVGTTEGTYVGADGVIDGANEGA